MSKNAILNNYEFLLVCGSILLISLFWGAVGTWVARGVARRIGFVDVPQNEAHKGHKEPTALLGGLGMFGGYIASFLIVLYIIRVFSVVEITGYLVGSAGAIVLGLYDDKFGMKASWKFIGQFLIAGIAVFVMGTRITLFVANPVFNVAITLFWFMLLMNAINFLDNMDGLAAGTVAIALLFFGIVAFLNGQNDLAIKIAMMLGVVIGFWCFNANPASIFMGDSGSLLLGFWLSVISCSVNYFAIDRSLSRFPILIPLFILAVPLFDAMMVVLIRTYRKKAFWIGDHNHISHRFVHMGLSRKRAVGLVHGLCVFAGLCVFPILYGNFTVALAVVIQMFILLLIVSFLQFTLAKKEKQNG